MSLQFEKELIITPLWLTQSTRCPIPIKREEETPRQTVEIQAFYIWGRII